MNPSKSGLNVLLIRHAESRNNVLYEIYQREEYESVREPDPDLSELGELQATYLGSHIAAHPSLYNLSYIYCSAMTRALKTADFIAREIRVDCEVWPDIYEIEGCNKLNTPHTGKTKTEISTLFPNIKLPPECTEEGWFLQDRIETHEEAWERAGRVVQKLYAMARDDSNKGKTIAIVTHGLFLDYLLGRVVGRQMRESPSFGFSNTGVSMLMLNGNSCKINYVNAVPHLYRSDYSSSNMNV